MTKNELWKNTLEEKLKNTSIAEMAEQYITRPCLVTASKLENEILTEEFVCPYCFEKTVIAVEKIKSRYHRKVCSHCGKVFMHESQTYKNETIAKWGNDQDYSNTNFILTRATLNGLDGIFFVEVKDINLIYYCNDKKVIYQPNIVGCGFAFVGGHYRLVYDRISRSRITSHNRVFSKFLADESFFDFMENAEIKTFHEIDKDNPYSYMLLLETKEEPKKTGTISVLERKANKFMDKVHVDEVDNDIFSPFQYVIYDFIKSDNISGDYWYNGHCLSCGAKFKLKEKKQLYFGYEEGKCPKCGKGNKLIINGYGGSKAFTVIDKANEDVIVARVFECTYKFENKKLIINAEETNRIYYNFADYEEWDKVVLFKDFGNWKYKNNGEIPRKVIQEDGLIITPLASERLKYTGLEEFAKEAIKKENNLLGSFGLSDLNYYFLESAKSNHLEKLAKIGWIKLCKEQIVYSDNLNTVDFNTDGKNVCEVLKIPRRLFNFIGEKCRSNPSSHDVAFVQKLYALDESVQIEDINWLIQNSINIAEVRSVINILKINVHQICEYLERVRTSQCFEPEEAIIQWIDYLNASEKIKVDLTDKTMRYPSSLKREHDRVAFKFKLIKNEEKERFFRESCENYGKRYSYENDKYIIAVPNSMNDLFEEGRKLNHCVGQYADNVADGKTCICFIRKKEEPEKPYFTMEITPNEDRVRQLKGLSNRSLDKQKEKELYVFLKAWAKKKSVLLSVA